MDLGWQTALYVFGGLVIGGLLGAVAHYFYAAQRYEKQIRVERRRVAQQVHNQVKTEYERKLGDLRDRSAQFFRKARLADKLQQDNAALTAALQEQYQTAVAYESDLERTRGNLQRVQEEFDALHEENERNKALAQQAAAQLTAAIREFTEFEKYRQALQTAASQLRQLLARNRQLEAELARLKQGGGSAPESSPLSEIPGLKPHYAQRLTESGIHSIAQLASADVEQVAKNAGLSASRLAEAAGWVEAARRLLKSE